MADRAIETAARDLLERSTRQGRLGTRSFRFTAPSPRHYPFQWLWDSCFQAIVWARFDVPRAIDELEGLLALQRARELLGLGNTQVSEDSRPGWLDTD